MKKKLFLFITCFFLFSSLVIFLTYRNIHLSDQNIRLSEIIKKEKEVKKSLKEQKEKNSSNYRDELPWQLNWKGATVSLVVCGLIAVPGGRICNGSNEKNSILITEVALLAILFFGLSPFLLASDKYKDKSYKERYCLLWRDYWKPFVCFVLSVFFVVLLMGPYDNIFKKKPITMAIPNQ